MWRPSFVKVMDAILGLAPHGVVAGNPMPPRMRSGVAEVNPDAKKPRKVRVMDLNYRHMGVTSIYAPRFNPGQGRFMLPGLTRHRCVLTRGGFALTRVGDTMWRRFTKPIPNRVRKTPKNQIMKKLNVLLNTHVLAKFLPWTAKDRYRPEKYYMRGPGPKAKAKAKAKDRHAQSGDRASFPLHATDRQVR